MDDQWRQWTRELLQPDALTAPLLATLWREVLAFDTVLAGHVIDPVWVPSRTVVVAGSGKKTFKTLNVSTAASILAASCGAKTAKGVPRSVSAVSPLTYSTRSGFPWVSDSVPLTGNGGDTDRGTAANTVAFTPPGSALDALERPATGGELTAVTYRYRRMDADVASWRLIRPATSHLRLLDELHRDAPPATCRRGLAAAVSEAAGLAAWLCFDMGDAARAHDHYRHAVRAAGAAGDPLLGGYMLGSMGWLAIQVGDGDAALELIRAAKAKVGPDSPATSCAWLAAHEALAQATLRDTHKALALLDSAADAVGRAASDTSVWPWLYPFGPGKLAAFSGSCSLRLGRADEARGALQEALRLRPAGATARAAVVIDLVSALLMRRKPEVDIDEVGQLVAEAAGIAASKGSARLWRQVRETRTRLRPWDSSRAVRRLDELLRSCVA